MTQSLNRLEEDELSKLSSDLKYAIIHHINWFNHLTLGLLTDGQLNEAQFINMDAHVLCNFGKWLNIIQRKKDLDHQLLEKIDKSHQVLHQNAREAITSVQSGEFNRESYKRMQSAQATFIEQLLQLFEESVIYQHQFDPLTGLTNRRIIDTILKDEHARTKRLKNSELSIAMADLDKFKFINDTYGHDVGDEVLSHCADIMKEHSREYDVICRYGGEEFLLIFPETPQSEALIIVERIRKAIEVSKTVHGEHTIRVTASFGLATLNAERTIDEVIKLTDKAMYKAKSNGRNRVVTI